MVVVTTNIAATPATLAVEDADSIFTKAAS
jgi:hypothetical protein